MIKKWTNRINNIIHHPTYNIRYFQKYFKYLPNPAFKIIKLIWIKFRENWIKITRNEIDEKCILNDLKRIGVKRGDTLFVHSSLKNIGYVKGGADTIINALQATIGDTGTLIMPCLSFQILSEKINNKQKIFNPKTEPSCVGIISETFRKKPGVYRSVHPTHSICACGKYAKWITQDHEKCNTIFGIGSPWYKLMDINTKILGLGVGLGYITFYHVIEDCTKNFPLDVYDNKDYSIEVMDYSNKLFNMYVKAHNVNVAQTRIEKNEWVRNHFQQHLENKGLIFSKIGNAHSFLIEAKSIFDIQKELLDQGITIYTTKEEYEKMNHTIR